MLDGCVLALSASKPDIAFLCKEYGVRWLTITHRAGETLAGASYGKPLVPLLSPRTLSSRRIKFKYGKAASASSLRATQYKNAVPILRTPVRKETINTALGVADAAVFCDTLVHAQSR